MKTRVHRKKTTVELHQLEDLRLEQLVKTSGFRRNRIMRAALHLLATMVENGKISRQSLIRYLETLPGLPWTV